MLPMMVGTIIAVSAVLIALTMTPVGWLIPMLAPVVGTVMQTYGVANGIKDVLAGLYLFTDAVIQTKEAKSSGAMKQASALFTKAFKYVGPNLLMDILNYQCKDVLPYVYQYILDADEELRYRAIIALGWIGNEEDFDKLKERVENETNISNKGYALSAMRQMFFRFPQLKNKILNIYCHEMTITNNNDIILIIGLCVQDLLRKKLNIKEDEKGIHSKDSPEIIKAKVMKLFLKDHTL